ncbi:MAG: Cell surface glycan-binding lipoprotein, utilization system for glycans and polysaccharides (PUL), SusD family [uncultured Adhaeribacter sp.]|uniref:Cell surface glycan-binding lipoprotein, utilization system for glycans and polysaccharides (PUL), SusD family n=1 Tax=uncultured Adhaeribacter sp. TaxID=448109 RepID=A0A6J4J218_9BACT|nr:MAG: Cell surface glycan-binding lipoprotein, utilization system for glycans and polysaccharides (PUL), SusD family [uncultured Adhaeribacter sp.]
MKNSNIYQYSRTLGLATLLMATVPACKDFLDVPPQGQITEDEIRSNPQAAQDLVTGVYNVMWIGGFGPDVHSFQYVILTNIASDDADKGSTPQDYGDALDVDNLTLTPNNSNINNVWTGYYQAIARANQALDKLPLSPADETTKRKLEGEVRFLRGYFYFNLVRLFGGVPKLDRVPLPEEANSDQFQTRASEEEIYQLIISDLQFAVDNLPEKGQTTIGRATKGAAQGMLAKVYLYRQDYQKAFELSGAVITAGKYTLHPRYEEIWRETGNNNNESIFEVQAGINAECNAATQLYTVSQGPRQGGRGGWRDLGFGFNSPSESLVNEYEPNDRRRDATIIFINPSPRGTVLYDGFRVPSKDSVENFRYNYKAYHSRLTERNCGNNDFLPKQIRVMRYAEVLLIHAEAALALGNTGAAQTDIDQIRARVNLAPVPVTREAIWHERRVELAMEHDRFFDLVRQEKLQPGRAVQAFAAHGKTFVKGKNEVFPIPQTQRDLSGGKLTQNPGY